MNPQHELRITNARASLGASTAALIAFVEQLPDTTAVRALPGGWTPAGHVSHVALTNDIFRAILSHGPGCSSPLPPFEGTSAFGDDAWSTDAPQFKAASPSMLIPSPGTGRAEAAAQLRASAAALDQAIATVTPAAASLCVQLPWGVVSLYQLCEYAGAHTIRHLAQVNRELQAAAARSAPTL